MLTDSSFQRCQHRRGRTQTSAVQVQHELDQHASACIWPFKQPSPLGPSICINAGTFVIGTITFRPGESLSGEGSGANALHCLGCFGQDRKWKQNASACARELARFLLNPYICAKKASEEKLKNLAKMDLKLTQTLKIALCSLKYRMHPHF